MAYFCVFLHIPVGRTTYVTKRKLISFLLYISTYCNDLRIRSCSFFRYSLRVRAISG